MRLNKLAIFTVVTVSLTMLLAGCGRKGPLYLRFNAPADQHTTNPYVPNYEKTPPNTPPKPAVKTSDNTQPNAQVGHDNGHITS